MNGRVRIGGLVLLVSGMVGCGALEPIDFDVDMTDLELSNQILRTEVRDNERVLTGLRGDIQVVRKKLGRAQVLNARLKGQLRETERRYAEARHIVDLQRGEISRARSKQEQVLQTGRDLQAQMRQLQQQLTRFSTHPKKKVSTSRHAARPRQRLASPSSIPSASPPRPTPRPKKSQSVTAWMPPSPAPTGARNNVLPRRHTPNPDMVAVKVGDTLWSLARKYGVNLAEMEALNDLTSDLIMPGQALRLPIVFSGEGRHTMVP